MFKKVLFLLSVLMNISVLLVGLLLFFKLGGMVYFENRISRVLANEPNVNPIVEIRNENLELVGDNQVDIVFLGDSHTNYFEWGEYYTDFSVANRGIGSDTTHGVLSRIEGVSELNPDKVFIMVGINDIQQGVNPDNLVSNYENIIEELSSNNEGLEIYVQSILPVAGDLYESNFYRESEPINYNVAEINEDLSNLDNIIFIDLSNAFGSSLLPEYSVDGIHLNKVGYDTWLNEINTYID